MWGCHKQLPWLGMVEIQPIYDDFGEKNVAPGESNTALSRKNTAKNGSNEREYIYICVCVFVNIY